VVQGHEHPLLKRSTLAAGQLSWISGTAPDPDKSYTAKTRYRQTDAACHITTLYDDTLELVFDTPQWAVTPGQSVVLYDGEVCLGGGIIT
jgi:tRNA-uridine 2-sulfurtransferase